MTFVLDSASCPLILYLAAQLLPDLGLYPETRAHSVQVLVQNDLFRLECDMDKLLCGLQLVPDLPVTCYIGLSMYNLACL